MKAYQTCNAEWEYHLLFFSVKGYYNYVTTNVSTSAQSTILRCSILILAGESQHLWMHGGRCIVSDMTCSSSSTTHSLQHFIRYEHHIPHVQWHLKNYKLIDIIWNYLRLYINFERTFTYKYLLFGHFTQKSRNSS